MSGEKLRAFVAIGLPDEVREVLVATQARLRERLPAARWVRPEGIHLTLHFLGDISPGLARRLGDGLAEACAPLPAFELSLGALGVFPAVRRARVLWAGVEAPDTLFDAHGAIGKLLRYRKLPVERRPYRPHLTLARLRAAPDEAVRAALREAIDEGPLAGPPFPAGEIRLYRSELGPGGARYSVLARAPLGG